MTELASLVSQLSPERRRLLEDLAAKEGLDGRKMPIVPCRDRGERMLSFAQQRLWFLDQLEPGSVRYNMSSAFRLPGPLDRQSLERALNEVVRRHESLRTSFPMVDGQPVQRIASERILSLEALDLRDLPEGDKEARVREAMAAQQLRPFDLAQGPLLRASVVTLTDDAHFFLLTLHHIVVDGWSAGLLQRELVILDEAFRSGRPSPLPELPIQYADFSHWQRQWLRGETLESLLGYWRARLAGAPPVLELPTDRPRPAKQSFNGAMQFFFAPASLAAAAKNLGQQENATLFMVLLTAFVTLLRRYTERSDIVLGTTIANRNRAELEMLIGFFVNTLVLRVDLPGAPSFRRLLARARDVALGAFANQDLPFEKLVEDLQPERDLSHNPLIQIMFDLQNVPTLEPILSADSPQLLPAAAKLDLSLSMRETSDGLVGALEYNTDLFDHQTITRMAAHLKTLLSAATTHPDRPVSRLAIMPEDERQRVVYEWNETDAKYPRARCVHELFTEQAARTPGAVALEFRHQVVSYAELERRSNQLAHHLRATRIGVESHVGLCVERSPEAVVGLLGVLQAGAAFVPMAQENPAERLDFMAADAGVAVLLANRDTPGRLSPGRVPVLRLDADWPEVAGRPTEPPRVAVSPDNLACITYTSGSTGRPKGVLTPHRGLVNVVAAQRRLFALGRGDRVLQFASLSFDASTFEILAALCSGAALCLLPADEVPPGPALADQLRQRGVTFLTMPPSALAALPFVAPPDLPTITVAGEACPISLVQRWAAGRRFFNLYGPTEAAIWSTAACNEAAQPPPIGRPIQNVRSYVLDPLLQPVPARVPGELCIGGVGLARGYLGRPALSAQRFVPDPLETVPGSRLYRSGDRSRWGHEGALEFIGRMDRQVKLRGYRIELGEIEETLLGHPRIETTVVAAQQAGGGGSRLVAYFVTKGEGSPPTTSELRGFLKRALPEYMIPVAYVAMKSLPVLPSGKIDQKALTSHDLRRPELETVFVEPRTPTERALAVLWRDLLDLERVGAHDSFFELGGHSLLATRLMARIRNRFGVELTVDRVFTSPALDELAMLIDSAEIDGPSPGKEITAEPDSAALLQRVGELSDEDVDALLSSLLEEEGGAAGAAAVAPTAPPEPIASGKEPAAKEDDWSAVLARVDDMSEGEVDTMLKSLLAEEEGRR